MTRCGKLLLNYKVGVSEIINANSQITNPILIYPYDQITILTTNQQTQIFEQELIQLTNVERLKTGLKPLSEDWELSKVVRHKSMDIAGRNYFSHKSLTYGSPFDMIRAYGITYRSAGENIAKGQRTPQQVVNA